jgi:hypothetical protein
MASTVDAAISALVALLEAASSLDGVSVHDGPPMTAQTPDWIAVGYQPDSSDAVLIDYEFSQLGAGKQREKYDVLCSLLTTSGDTAMSTRRSRAIALRDAVAQVLADNRELGVPSSGIWLAEMTSAALLQEQGPKGALAGFKFSITVQARITS